MIARKVCLFPTNDFISAPAGPRPGMLIMASGIESQGTCIEAEALKEAQLG
jgi:hypothetical protein